MSLTPGARLGVYEVTAQIGAGGMGEVWRARDTTLDRDVALKVLPEAFTADPDRLARFEREAKVLASLNHPHIGGIYGLEDDGATLTRALVLELVEGPTLAERIAEGPLPVDDALPIARQIAEALEAAHEQGIIHRDLKPANIKLRSDGTVKVLDFGLAKAMQSDGGDTRASQSPTMSLTAAATQMGMVIGTAAYMAPEQAKGKAVDRRADIWAFGAVLYEMLTGRQAFRGEDISSTLAKVIERDPDWTPLPARTPSSIRTLLRRCLVKDPKRRLPDIGVARLEIDDAVSGKGVPSEVAAAQAPPARWPRPLALAGLSILSAMVAGLAVWLVTAPDALPVSRFEIPVRELEGGTRNVVAISPDGRQIVYTTSEGLALRSLEQVEPFVLAGTDGAREPFFSPDGQWIGFWATGQLKKIAVSGGAPVTLCETEVVPSGASWGEDDTILFGRGVNGVWRVPGRGGAPERVIDVNQPVYGPHMLPGGDAVLFTLYSANGGIWDEARIVAQSLSTGDLTVLVEGGRDGRYVPTGHLLYARQGTLIAVPFDLRRLAVTGGPVALVEGISDAGASSGAAHYSLASEGALVYLQGAGAADAERTLVWVDRQGREATLEAAPRPYTWVRVSPDGTRVALEVQDGGNTDVWIHDVARGTAMRLTFAPGADRWPLWTPDGRRVVFASGRDLVWKASDGTGDIETLATSLPLPPGPSGWSADGTRLVYDQRDPLGGTFVMAMNGNGTPEALLGSESFRQVRPAVSPDGRWMAYISNESGRDEIYVRPFPDVGSGRWQISTTGGTSPLWSPDGRELFYDGGGALVRVAIDPTATASVSAGPPEVLFEGSYFWGFADVGRAFDIAPDGQRFLLIKERLDEEIPVADPVIFLVQNWVDELVERVPVD